MRSWWQEPDGEQPAPETNASPTLVSFFLEHAFPPPLPPLTFLLPCADWTKTVASLDRFVQANGIDRIAGVFGFSQGGALAALLVCNRLANTAPALAAALEHVSLVVVAGAPHDHLPRTPASPEECMAPPALVTERCASVENAKCQRASAS